ncbi:helix-turn-helix domain-containing protein [Novacetimonas hansenii]|uniref:helix-turn-helix transcriptional regulator n=1 Tax=Novacetimonas hansenii TaxID=436 RepID=UPI001FF2A4CE|nr:helix-turn-helix transcriptional regulator [Novacetimonas hansenii]
MHTQPDPVPAPHTRRAPLRPGISHRTRPPRIDWSRLDPQVAHLRDSGLSNRETARRLNLNVKTMETRLRHLRLHQAATHAATHMALRGDEVRRACLNCDAAFIADGRFLRLCPTCRTMFG